MKVDGDDPLTDVEVPPISNQVEGEKHVRLKDATTPSRNQGKKLSDFYTRWDPVIPFISQAYSSIH